MIGGEPGPAWSGSGHAAAGSRDATDGSGVAGADSARLRAGTGTTEKVRRISWKAMEGAGQENDSHPAGRAACGMGKEKFSPGRPGYSLGKAVRPLRQSALRVGASGASARSAGCNSGKVAHLAYHVAATVGRGCQSVCKANYWVERGRFSVCIAILWADRVRRATRRMVFELNREKRTRMNHGGRIFPVRHGSSNVLQTADG